MKVLLIGEYSNVHATLAAGLRRLGHDVLVVSDGDGWKGYPRDVDIKRPVGGFIVRLRYWLRLRRLVRTLRGYDVVQLINPIFLPLKAERHWAFYRYLRRHNRKVFLGAFGMDYYYAQAALDGKAFRYSDFNIGSEIRRNKHNDIWMRDWVNGEKGRLNKAIAADCDGIVAGLYEYFAAYVNGFQQKLAFIPFPIRTDAARCVPIKETPKRVRFFIGIQRARSDYKGTDIMLRALERIVANYPNDCEMVKVESAPFEEYKTLLAGSHVILDQLYSYTPAMNALEAMANGLVVVGGGEPENYAILHEDCLRPIVNVEPTEESVYEALKQIVVHKESLPRLSQEGVEYIAKHHDYIHVAKQYLDFWNAHSR